MMYVINNLSQKFQLMSIKLGRWAGNCKPRNYCVGDLCYPEAIFTVRKTFQNHVKGKSELAKSRASGIYCFFQQVSEGEHIHWCSIFPSLFSY